VTITTQSSANGATTLSRMDFSGYVGQLKLIECLITIACCLAVGLALGLGLYLVTSLLVVIHTYLY